MQYDRYIQYVHTYIHTYVQEGRSTAASTSAATCVGCTLPKVCLECD